MQTKLTSDILAAAIEGFEAEKARIDDKISEIKQMLGGGVAEHTGTHVAPVATRKKFSVAARKRMALAQQLRYAKFRGETQPPTPVASEASTETPKAKRKISAEGMKRIIAATKKRWADKKAADAEVSAQKAPVKKTAVKPAPAKKTATKKAAAKKSAPNIAG